MHKQSGFSLLELMIVLLVGTMLTAALLQMMVKTTGIQKRLDAYMKDSSELLAVQLRIRQDLLGLSKLWFSPFEYEQVATREGKMIEQPEKIERKNLLYAKSVDNHLELCTFVTTAGMFDMQAGSCMFVRVVYTVKQDESTGLYTLFRKEILHPAADVSDKALQEGITYPLLTHLRVCKFEFGFLPSNPDMKDDKPQMQLLFTDQWSLLLKDQAVQEERKNLSAQEKEKEMQEEKKPILPLPVVVKVTLLFDGQELEEALVSYHKVLIDGTSELPFIYQAHYEQEKKGEQVQKEAEGQAQSDQHGSSEQPEYAQTQAAQTEVLHA